MSISISAGGQNFAHTSERSLARLLCAPNQPTFELRNGSKDMEHQLARSGGSIDPLIQADHPVCGFRLTFWCRRAPNCPAAAHQVRQRVGKISKFAKCSTLE